MTNDQAEKLLNEAEDLLRTAWAAMLKMGLRDRGSDIRLPHEVRMFAAHFSEEGRDGPGALQILGTGRFRAWSKAHREVRNAGVPTYVRTEPTQPWTPEHCRSYPTEAAALLNARGVALGDVSQDATDARRYRALRDVFSRPYYFSSDTGTNLDAFADKLAAAHGVAVLDAHTKPLHTPMNTEGGNHG